jgi:hypothetical protein
MQVKEGHGIGRCSHLCWRFDLCDCANHLEITTNEGVRERRQSLTFPSVAGLVLTTRGAVIDGHAPGRVGQMVRSIRPTLTTETREGGVRWLNTN